jgi:hypothetical protein
MEEISVKSGEDDDKASSKSTADETLTQLVVQQTHCLRSTILKGQLYLSNMKQAEWNL